MIIVIVIFIIIVITLFAIEGYLMYRAGTQQTQLTSHWLISPHVIHVFYLNLLRDYDAFLGDLEEDKSYRQNINIYVGTSLH